MKDGTLEWEVPPGKWTIMRFGKRNNGAVTRPAPAPGLGFEADKFDTASFNAHYDAYIGKLIKKVQPQKIRIRWRLDNDTYRQLGNGFTELEP